MGEDFRFVLKQQTQAHHEDVDRAMSELDLAVAADYARFLQINLLGFRAMRAAVPAESAAALSLAAMIRQATADLAVLGRADPGLPLPVLAPVHPLAAEYVIEGSRLGSQVLKRLWARSEDANVLQAGAYLTQPRAAEAWRDVCARLSTIDATSSEAAEIIQDSRRIFDCFLEVCQQLNTPATGEVRAVS